MKELNELNELIEKYRIDALKLRANGTVPSVFKADYSDQFIKDLEQLRDKIEQKHKEDVEMAWNSAGGGDAYYSGEQYYEQTHGKK